MGRQFGVVCVLGYQLFILLAATGYLLGATQSKEYAEPEWYTDIWLTIVWVAYLAVFFGTILKRREPYIYVANWFLLSFIITVAMLHLVNNISIPVSIYGSKSVQVFAGVQDALIQWWYGHNAVGFFLTAGFLGMMYYFVPKQAERPVYSYKLSIVHFWSLIFLYIWAGPHHLQYTALPDWAQTLGMVFSVMLWMPSWGGMINGLMTLSGAWDKLRTDPVLRIMVLSIGFYGMSTFEGPVMSIKSINVLSHYTDWTIGHVHSGALGWNGMITFGVIYFLVPRLWNKPGLYSLRLVNWHFWLATLGIVLYAAAMSGERLSLAPQSAMDAARASADIILLNGRLDILPDVLKLSKVARLRMLQNFGLAALYNIITIPLAFSGFATPLMAALAMSLSSITVTLNAFRLPKINKGNAPDLFQPQQERAP